MLPTGVGEPRWLLSFTSRVASGCQTAGRITHKHNLLGVQVYTNSKHKPEQQSVALALINTHFSLRLLSQEPLGTHHAHSFRPQPSFNFSCCFHTVDTALLPSCVSAARPIIAFYSRFRDICIYIYNYIYIYIYMYMYINVCLHLHCTSLAS